MAELLPTQDIDDVHENISEPVENKNIWGRLLPLDSRFPSIDLVDETYTFGRGEDCSFTFQLSMFESSIQFSTISKEHFKITLENTNNGLIVFINDISSNGTFVNGTKLGRGKRRPLNNNDEISLSLKHLKCFIFSDSNFVHSSYPPEVTDKYTISKHLGRGAYGEVRLIFDRENCEKFAMKIVQKKRFSVASKLGKVFNPVQAEVDILMKLNHPCIIQIYDVVDTSDALYMVLELVEGGELFDRILKLGQLTESDSQFFFLQMALAVKYLHQHGITHRDLKPENILLTSSAKRCLIKVTDFGVSKLVDESTMLRTFCGTPDYLAPEVLKTAGCGAYTCIIDVWSLGVILYICLVGYPPFTRERTDCELEAQILEGLYDFPDKFWHGISEQAINLIRSMLTVDPANRKSINEVIQDPWLSDPLLQKEVELLIQQSQRQSSNISNTNTPTTTTSGNDLHINSPVSLSGTNQADCSQDLLDSSDQNHISTNLDNAQVNDVQNDITENAPLLTGVALVQKRSGDESQCSPIPAKQFRSTI